MIVTPNCSRAAFMQHCPKLTAIAGEHQSAKAAAPSIFLMGVGLICPMIHWWALAECTCKGWVRPLPFCLIGPVMAEASVFRPCKVDTSKISKIHSTIGLTRRYIEIGSRARGERPTKAGKGYLKGKDDQQLPNTPIAADAKRCLMRRPLESKSSLTMIRRWREQSGKMKSLTRLVQ